MHYDVELFDYQDFLLKNDLLCKFPIIPREIKSNSTFMMSGNSPDKQITIDEFKNTWKKINEFNCIDNSK